MRHLLAITLALTCKFSFAQTEAQRRQNEEYKRLSEATRRAFSVPNKPASTSTYKPSASFGSTSSASSSAGSRTNYAAVSFASDNYSWADYSQVKRQNKPSLNDKLRSDFAAKMELKDKLIAQRKLVPKKENYRAIMQCFLDAGFDFYSAERFNGSNETEYQEMLDRQAASDPKPASLFTGSTKAECSGPCTETLVYRDNSGTYVGNTAAGRPHGSGVLTLSNGDKFTGIFKEGTLQGDIVLNFANGDNYEGGFYKTAFFGDGKFTFADGEINEGYFKNNKLNGLGRITSKKSTSTGYYKEGKIDTKGERLTVFSSGTTILRNFDIPSKSKITWPGGVSFNGEIDAANNPVNGTAKYSSEESFTGIFKNFKPYKGLYEGKQKICEGIFTATLGDISVGRQTDKTTGDISETFINEAGQNHGYRIDYLAVGQTVEAIYSNGAYTGPVKIIFQDNSIFIGLKKYMNYENYGLLKDTSGNLTLIGIQNGQWVTPPETERDNIMKVVGETVEALKKGRADYLAAIL